MVLCLLQEMMVTDATYICCQNCVGLLEDAVSGEQRNGTKETQCSWVYLLQSMGQSVQSSNSAVCGSAGVSSCWMALLDVLEQCKVERVGQGKLGLLAVLCQTASGGEQAEVATDTGWAGHH